MSYKMKNLMYLLFLSSYFFGCLCTDTIYENEVVGNPDDYAIIVRPCQVSDLNCIRDYFKDHSKCEVRKGPLPGHLVRSQYSVYLSRVNVSADYTNLRIDGFNNTVVEEFYVNKATNKAVLSIRIRNVTHYLPSGYFKFYRNGREPIVVLTTAGILYRSVSYTTIIPDADDLSLEKAEVTAFSDDSNPPYFIGNELTTNPDPTVRQAVTEIAADPATDLQELFLTEAPYFPITYIQTNICDFGLKVT